MNEEHRKEGGMFGHHEYEHDLEFGKVHYYAGPEFQQPESGTDRFVRKFKADPLVPIGCLVTAGALGLGFNTFRKGGNPELSQKFMRYRVVLQGATIAAFGAGVMINSMLPEGLKDTLWGSGRVEQGTEDQEK